VSDRCVSCQGEFRYGSRFGKVIGRSGKVHIIEECLDCHGNARGKGVRVPLKELGCSLDELPVYKGLTETTAPKPVLRAPKPVLVKRKPGQQLSLFPKNDYRIEEPT
jgi:hypothetical protein